MRILVVDDDWMQRTLLNRILVHEGYEVKEAESGAECIDLIKTSTFDVIILDVNLPDFQGSDIVSELRVIPWTGRIIMISGMDNHKVQQQCTEAGADAYLVKPFDPEHLMQILAEVA